MQKSGVGSQEGSKGSEECQVMNRSKAVNLSAKAGPKTCRKWAILGVFAREKRGQKGEYRVSKAVEMAAFCHAGGLNGGAEGDFGPNMDIMSEP